MSTNSLIAAKMENNQIQMIYCHWNGYFDYNGEMLQAYYNTPELARQLVSLGDICSLKENIEETKKEAYEDIKNVIPKTFEKKSDLVHKLKDYIGIEYLYYFNGEEWETIDVYGRQLPKLEWHPLNEVTTGNL